MSGDKNGSNRRKWILNSQRGKKYVLNYKNKKLNKSKLKRAGQTAQRIDFL